jgi:disulfide bond formation protein DsbB
VLNLAGFAACAALLAYAIFVQGVLRIEPCPLCIFQRVGLAAAGVVFLVAGLHAPRAPGARAYGTLLLLACAATIAIAARHVWIQHLPDGAVPSCGPGLAYLLEEFPLGDVVRKVLTGSGECHQVNWTFLTLSMPTWVILATSALAALGFWANFVLPSRGPRGRAG